MYIAGPGNIIETFNYWKKGEDDPSQVAITYSGQFYDVCSTLNAEAYIISSFSEKQYLKDSHFKLENRPIPLSKQSGVLYHLGQIIYGVGLVISALQFRPDFIVVFNSEYSFILSILSKFGIKIIPTLHCALWSQNSLSKIQKLLVKMNKRFLSNDCLAILSISKNINEQVKKNTNNQQKFIINFLPTYRRNEFKNVKKSNHNLSVSKFQVLFAGRIEKDKGIFILLEIAKRFKMEGINDIVFNLCGTGSQVEFLCQTAKEYEIDKNLFIYHGHCNKTEMQQLLNSSHIVIVPTTSDFAEGFNKVVVEGVLAHRPIITSSVCPALNYVKEAVVEVAPNDIKAYGDAILKLRGDSLFYEQKKQSCEKLGEKFYDYSQSWGTALKSIIVDCRIDLLGNKRE